MGCSLALTLCFVSNIRSGLKKGILIACVKLSMYAMYWPFPLCHGLFTQLWGGCLSLSELPARQTIAIIDCSDDSSCGSNLFRCNVAPLDCSHTMLTIMRDKAVVACGRCLELLCVLGGNFIKPMVSVLAGTCVARVAEICTYSFWLARGR